MTAERVRAYDQPGLADLASLADPSVIADPYPLLARFREASPFTELDGGLVVFGRYEDCSRILRDPRASSERERSRLAPPGLTERPRARSFLSLDPPDHTRLRRLVARAFTPRVVATLAPHIAQITDELLTAAAPSGAGSPAGGGAGDGELELVSQLAYPLPVRIISELLGVPPEDHSRFAGWSAKLAHSVQPSFGALDPAERAAAEQASLEFGEYFSELIAVRRSRPADDLLTKLIRAEDAGDRLTVEELIATCVLLLVAGHETTVGLISNAMLALLRNPAQYAALAADPGLAADAVEETLRYDSPVQLTGRVARGGIAIDGMEPADGAVMLLLLAATGRDPAVFADPDVFDIRRGAREHLAFAAGPHFCLGAPLARLEATIALRSLATRLTSPVLDEDTLVYKPSFNLRGPERMVIRFDDIRPIINV
ncbi:MAG: cytochrome P450 [Nocardiopsaceae bacterium]|jgi:cytochrome P450|nr:cytochrome P450 [Nocardiopsaceae bacterium]